MKILVTGGAGFIGSHLVDTLLEDGHEVVALDNLSTGKPGNLERAHALGARFRFEKLDICAPLDGLFKEHAFEAVFHLAAQANVQKSIENPAFDAENNVLGTVNLLGAAKRFSVSRFVFASSVAIYGEPERRPVNESHPQHPLSPYGVSKAAAQRYLSYFHEQDNFLVDTLVLANVYGPRQDPYGEGGVVAVFANQMVGGQAPTIYGSGEQARDFVFVKDVVRAFALCLDETDRESENVLNIGTGLETSVNKLFDVLEELTDFRGKAGYKQARAGEIQAISVDPARALKKLGWTAETSIEKGLASTVQWFASLV